MRPSDSVAERLVALERSLRVQRWITASAVLVLATFFGGSVTARGRVLEAEEVVLRSGDSSIRLGFSTSVRKQPVLEMRTVFAGKPSSLSLALDDLSGAPVLRLVDASATELALGGVQQAVSIETKDGQERALLSLHGLELENKREKPQKSIELSTLRTWLLLGSGEEKATVSENSIHLGGSDTAIALSRVGSEGPFIKVERQGERAVVSVDAKGPALELGPARLTRDRIEATSKQQR